MGLSLSGLGSGLDWQSIIDQLRQAETAQRVNPLTTQKIKYEDRLDGWNTLASKLSALLTAVQDLNEDSDFEAFSVSLSSSGSTPPESILTGTAGDGAGEGRYEVVVNNLATAQKMQSGPAASDTTNAGWTGQISIEGQLVTLDGKSLNAIRDEINALNSGATPTGVIASVLKVSDTNYRLILTAEETGAAGFNFTDAAGDYFHLLQAGEDAAFSIDSIAMNRSSNTVTDAIPGVTLELHREDPATTVTVDVARDSAKVTEKVESFVNAYNGLAQFFNDQFEYDSVSESTGGALFGDVTAKGLRSQIQNTILAEGLFSVGITFNDDGTLALDKGALETALETDFSGSTSTLASMAQSLETNLSKMTDSIDGTVTLQTNSLQESIERIDDRIEGVNESIDAKMNRLTDQFIALDAALAQMQQQSEWLTTQLAGLSS